MPVPSSNNVLGSGICGGGVVAVSAMVAVHCVWLPTAVVMISLPVIAKGAVTLGEPSVLVGPKHACTGGAAAGNTQFVVRETAVAPVGPGFSALSLRSQPTKFSLPDAPVVKVPECVAESVPLPMGCVNPLTPKSI